MKSFFNKCNIENNLLTIKYWVGDYKSLIIYIKNIPKINITYHILFSIISKYKTKLNDFCFIYHISKIYNISVIKNYKPIFKQKRIFHTISVSY